MYKTTSLFIFGIFITTTFGLNNVEMVGFTVRLECQTNTTYDVRWIKIINGQPQNISFGSNHEINLLLQRVHYESNKRIMVIKKVQFKDAGTYACIQTNDINTDKYVNLTVTGTRLECIHNILDTKFDLGDTIHVSCDLYYNGNATIDMKWFNSSNMMQIKHPQILRNLNVNNYTKSYMMIVVTPDYNNQSLTCLALNNTLSWSSPRIYITQDNTSQSTISPIVINHDLTTSKYIYENSTILQFMINDQSTTNVLKKELQNKFINTRITVLFVIIICVIIITIFNFVCILVIRSKIRGSYTLSTR